MGKLKACATLRPAVLENECSGSPSPMILNVDQTSWTYRAEGNANLVLALPDTRQVLRLKKTDRSLATVDANESFQFLKTVVDYINRMSTTLPHEFVIEPQLLILLLKDMDLFNKQLNQYRPVERLSKEIRSPFAIMYPDVTFLPPYLTTSISNRSATFCVEIKPKQGWKFNGNPKDEQQFQRLFQLPDRSMLSKCRYCVMQHLKYKTGKINSLSNYCPLALFSGCLHKMTRAIRNLIDCPQNNLRIFRNGCQVYGDQQYHSLDRLSNVLEEIFRSKDRQRNLNQFAHLLCNILLKQYSSAPGTPQREAIRRREESNLPVNCVLQQILNVQRNVYDFFSTVDLNELEAQDVDSSDERNRLIADQLMRTGDFQRYQFGATALDCSLMITFQRRDEPVDDLVAKFLVQGDPHGLQFVSKVTVMDLDPKPFTHAVKYVEQTMAAYQTEWRRRQIII